MISIITPVYNSEKYIEKCIESILSQTFKDYELILVNDGSTDSSAAIIDSYAERYESIKVIHKDNSGPSDARNVGIKAANGEYLTYIDSDDYVAPNYLSALYNAVTKHDVDIAICNIAIYNHENEIKRYTDELHCEIKSGEDIIVKMLTGTFHGTSACGILLKNEIAKNNLFPSGKLHEDDLTSYKLFMNIDRVALIKESLYWYCQHEISIMHNGFYHGSIEELDVADFLEKEFSSMGGKYKKAVIVKCFMNYYQVLEDNNGLKSIDYATYRRIINKLRTLKWKMIFNPYSTWSWKKKSIWNTAKNN